MQELSIDDQKKKKKDKKPTDGPTVITRSRLKD
jgi:hypothetical protein